MLKKIANKILAIDNYAKFRRLYKYSNGFIRILLRILLRIYWSVIVHIKVKNNAEFRIYIKSI